MRSAPCGKEPGHKFSLRFRGAGRDRRFRRCEVVPVGKGGCRGVMGPGLRISARKIGVRDGGRIRLSNASRAGILRSGKARSVPRQRRRTEVRSRALYIQRLTHPVDATTLTPKRIELILERDSMPRTRAFKSGNSQAVRIPSELAYADTDIDLEITRLGDVITISPACNSLKDAVGALRRMPTPTRVEKRQPIDVPLRRRD
jgi:antitoxin VapB